MIYINCTTHTITLKLTDGTFVNIDPIAPAPRIQTEDEFLASIEGVALYERLYRNPVDIPPPKADTVYIVPSLVALWFADRSDFVVPKLVRDSSGGVNYVSGFCYVVVPENNEEPA